MNERPADTNLLRSHRARKRFGQNFLQDENVIQRILAAVLSCDAAESTRHFVEIGPGQGALTFPMIRRLAEQPASQLTLIELDRDLAAMLQPRIANNPQVELIEADALKFSFRDLLQRSDSKKLCIFGNLPYNISTPLIFHLLAQSSSSAAGSAEPLFSSMTFMLQKEVVERLCASPGSKAYGRLSVMTQLYCNAETLFDVPASAFRPQPKVTSSIARLTPRTDNTARVTNLDLFASIVRQSFAQRRKTLRNNLSDLVSAARLESLGIDPRRRAETLTLDDYIAIANSLDGGEQ